MVRFWAMWFLVLIFVIPFVLLWVAVRAMVWVAAYAIACLIVLWEWMKGDAAAAP